MSSGTASMPMISVLLTSYNRERYLAESIESVLAQTYDDFELILTDNCSTDRSLEIARDYAARDARIRVYAQERNIGQFANRRFAASVARGTFLKYHDSDDVMYRHCLQTMVEPMLAAPTAAFALSTSQYWPGGACPMLLSPALAYEREFLGTGIFQCGPACALFRTEAYHRLGGFRDEGVASDFLFWVRACAIVDILLVPGDLFYYRIHADQLLADPRNDVAYAKATAEAWRQLNDETCPLSPEKREQAKRNYTYIIARTAYRHLRQRRPASAAAVLRFAGLSAGEWLKYLRPPRRHPFAGTPTCQTAS